MQFGIMFANTGHGASPDGAKAVVEAAEAGGITTAWTVEHVVVPSGYESKYPYDQSGKMAGGAEDFDLPDPLIWLTWAAAHSTTLRLGTGILIATQRNPVITAKEVATLDHLSGGRLDLGVGVGWLEEEFNALGVPFHERGKRLDEYIDGDASALDRGQGQFPRRVRRLRRLHHATAPGQRDRADRGRRPHRGRRHAAPVDIGDGFFPGAATASEISALVAVMKRAADEAGRDGDAIPIYAMAMNKPGTDLDARIESLAEVGVRQAILPTFRPNMLGDIGRELVGRFG